jgi:hypothetical protein
MARPKDYERALQREETEYFSLKRRDFLDQDFKEGQNRRIDSLEVALRDEILTNPQFIGCVFMFLDWLQQHAVSGLRPVENKAACSSAKVFDIPELAGMTAASMLEDFLNKKNITYEFVASSGSPGLEYEVQSWITQKLMKITKKEKDTVRELTYPEAQLIYTALTTYMNLHKTMKPSFSRILPVEKLDRPGN